jgi:Tfp pilus assembly protein PilO
MSQDRPMPQSALAPRKQISIRFDQLKRSPMMNVIGLPELIGLVGAAVLVVVVVFAYLYFYLPARSRLNTTQAERERLQTLKVSLDAKVQTGLSVRDSVNNITSSLSTFENRWLAHEDSGRMSLYTVLNDLIKNNGLRNTAGPSYTPLEIAGTKQQMQPTLSGEKQSSSKWQSIYPGIAVSVTVEGPYQNVRHFVRDIEASRQFLIINAVELEQVTLSGAAAEQSMSNMMTQPGPGRLPAGPQVPGSRGTLVSLRIDLATYFQRPQDSVTP